MDLVCQQEWNKFNSMFSVESINFGEVQLYVDTLSPSGPMNNSFSLDKKNKSPFLTKNRKESMNENGR